MLPPARKRAMGPGAEKLEAEDDSRPENEPDIFPELRLAGAGRASEPDIDVGVRAAVESEVDVALSCSMRRRS